MMKSVFLIATLFVAFVAYYFDFGHHRHVENVTRVIKENGNQLKRYMTETDITCLATKAITFTNDEEEGSSEEWHCLVESGEDFNIYELSGLPEDFTNKFGSIMSQGNAWLVIEGGKYGTFFNFGRIIIPETANVSLMGAAESATKRLSYKNSKMLKDDPSDFTGKKEVLMSIVRSVDCYISPTMTILKDSLFGISGSELTLKSIVDGCSYDKVEMVGANGTNIYNGISFLYMFLPIRFLPRGIIVRYLIYALRFKIKNAQLHTVADNFIFCIPGCGEYLSNIRSFSFTYIGVSFLVDEYCQYPSFIVQGMTHNYGLTHSGVPGENIGDKTGIMGFMYESKEYPFKCYNAAKSYQLGWYENRTVSINLRETGTWIGDLVGVASYLESTDDQYVAIEFETGVHDDYFLQFNYAEGINRDTGVYQNLVTVVKDEMSTQSWLLAGLATGEEYTTSGFGLSPSNCVFKVCEINLNAAVPYARVSAALDSYDPLC